MWFERDGFYFETEEVVEIGSYYSGQPWKIFIPCFHWQKQKDNQTEGHNYPTNPSTILLSAIFSKGGKLYMTNLAKTEAPRLCDQAMQLSGLLRLCRQQQEAGRYCGKETLVFDPPFQLCKNKNKTHIFFLGLLQNNVLILLSQRNKFNLMSYPPS